MKNMIHEKDISDALLSFIKTKQIQLIDVRWFGGEPTLKLDYIISFSKKMRLILTIPTATLLWRMYERKYMSRIYIYY